jgi:hypothetical protein
VSEWAIDEQISGSPHLNFLRAMKDEHCSRFDSEEVFVTSNYKISTTPKTEWEIVQNCDSSKADMRENRRIPSTTELMTYQISKDAKLEEPEVFAVVLYTGPMVISTLCRSIAFSLRGVCML